MFTPTTMDSIYLISEFPSFVYNVAVWGPCFPALMEDIERIHVTALRIICRLPRTTTVDDIKTSRQWNPISSYLCSEIFGTFDTNIEKLNTLITDKINL